MPRLLFTFILLCLITSCSTTRKFDFKTAYKFKYLKYPEIKKDNQTPQLLASNGKVIALAEKKNTIPETIRMQANIEIRNSGVIKSAEKKSPGNLKEKTIAREKAGQSVQTKESKLEVAGVKKINKISRKAGFSDLHPALQGFLFVVFGFGLVLVGSLLGATHLIPLILVIAGFALVIFGFYKMLTHL